MGAAIAATGAARMAKQNADSTFFMMFSLF